MSKTEKLAILFADIAGSTRLYEALGNDVARGLTAQCLKLVSEVVTGKKGIVVKTIGDEVMAVFQQSDMAAEAAIGIQEKISNAVFTPAVTLRMRIGFHEGKVITENNDVYGDAVNVAARMTGEAKADQIITTSETFANLSPHLRACGRQLTKAHLHGKNAPVAICELTWGEVSDLTIISRSHDFVEDSSRQTSTLFLRYRDQEITVGKDNPLVTFGRDEENSVCIEKKMISRKHALVEWRSNGDFFLIDQSTNGVYLLTGEEGKRFVHRDAVQLTGSGMFCLSSDHFHDASEVVYYSERG